MKLAKNLCVALVVCAVGCSSDPEPTKPGGPIMAKTLPELGKPTKTLPSVSKYEIALPIDKPTNRVWIYLPEPAKAKVPCILIAPAGSPLFHGIAMAYEDELEHVPYAKAGYAVIAYDLDGDTGQQRPTTQQALAAAQAFKDSKAGLQNEKDALDYALAKVPQIDPNRIYMVGHSSAGAHALLMASQDPRIKACVGFAPVSEVADRMDPKAIETLDKNIPGFRDFVNWLSPDHHLDTLKCPVLIFHAKDDDVVPVEMSIDFQKKLAKTNKNTVLKLVEKGGHYQSMLDQGIPAAIKWLNSLPH